MKKAILFLSMALFGTLAGSHANAQDQAQMKKWMDYMTPGDMQKMLASNDGKWKGDISMWMDPSGPAMKSESVAENKMIMGGRYQHSDLTGSFNGMPFEGQSTMGYDNAKKVFVSTWIDNMGTGVMCLEGPYDAATKTITLRGKMVDPMTGKDIMVREVMKYTDDKTQMMQMYEVRKGTEVKTMEVKYTRL